MTFQQLNLSEPVLRAVAQAGYKTPSPIQAKAIPPVLAGRDLMGCAQTGTGKTAAFALPILDLLTAKPARKNGAVRALILTPTRELALQIGESFEAYGKYLSLRCAVVFGGVGQAPQVAALKKGVDILVACPGRLNDLIGQGYADLGSVEIFVLDEADRMLDMGFVHDVKKVIAKLPAKRQNLMFSATMPTEIEQLAAGILQKPAFVKVDPVSSTVEKIRQSLYYVEKGNKRYLLPWLIKNLDPPVENALVFSRTKHGADKIVRDLTKQGITAAAIHGNKSQSARVAALEGFKAGRTQVLVATDIAARGIDINELAYVFNYDLPEVPETYVHRIGRTARAGADGAAVSFCCPDEQEYLAGIEKLNRRQIPVVTGHPWENVPAPTVKVMPLRGKHPAQAAKQTKPGAPASEGPQEKKEEKNMEETEKRAESAAKGEGRSRRRGRSQRAENTGNKPAAQAKFDPHFLAPADAAPIPPKAAAPMTNVRDAARSRSGNLQGGQNSQEKNSQNIRPAQQKNAKRGGRTGGEEKPERQSARNTQNSQKKPAGDTARPAKAGRQNNQNAQNTQAEKPARAAKGRNNKPAQNAPAAANQQAGAPVQNTNKAARTARRNASAVREDEPGLLLISRRPPQQKYSSFEEYMEAHGGASAPIEDHSNEI